MSRSRHRSSTCRLQLMPARPTARLQLLTAKQPEATRGHLNVTDNTTASHFSHSSTLWLVVLLLSVCCSVSISFSLPVVVLTAASGTSVPHEKLSCGTKCSAFRATLCSLNYNFDSYHLRVLSHEDSVLWHNSFNLYSAK